MELVRGLHNLREAHRGCAATIGSFDGVHLGHQAVLASLAESAADMQVPATLITFEPQPREYFMPGSCPPRLTRLREKLEALDATGIDRVVCLRFNDSLASLSPEDFVRVILLEGLAVRYLVVGDDFRFGRERAGDFALLEQIGAEKGFPVVATQTFDVAGERVSSTRIREALVRGDMAAAESLLGRRYSMCGRVAHGDKRGRTIGFPTANIYLHRAVSPLAGVFTIEMHGAADRPLQGVANVGTRPTVDGTRSLLEVHLFDFAGDIYGRHVRVEFLSKLRDEQRYDSFEALKQQIEKDVMQAKVFFRS